MTGGAVHLFEGWDDADIARVARHCLAFEASPGVMLVREDDPGDFMLLILEGEVEVLRTSRLRVPVKLALAGPGQMLGEMSMFDGAPRFASCIAATRVRFIAMDYAGLKALQRESPVLASELLLRFLMIVSDRLRDTSLRLLDSLDRR